MVNSSIMELSFESKSEQNLHVFLAGPRPAIQVTESQEVGVVGGDSIFVESPLALSRPYYLT